MTLRIALPCSGLGHVHRGFERFTVELGRALGSSGAVDARVFGPRVPRDLSGRSIPCVHRAWLQRVGVGADRAYRIEQLTFSVGLLPILVGTRVDVVHVSDPAICSALLHARRRLGLRYRLVFCNGGGLSSEHWARFDHTQLVTPAQAQEALDAGVPRDRFSVVPLGIDPARLSTDISQAQARRTLGLPTDELLLISVAALDASTKRLDYVISELARTDRRWSLVCLGNASVETPILSRLAEAVAPRRVYFRTASPQEVPTYLAAADALTLASRTEGFGLALLEGMAAGLPVIARDIPSLRFLVRDDEQLAPLLEAGELAGALERLSVPADRARLGSRNRTRASELRWDALVPAYVDMYRRSAAARAAPESA